MNSSSEQNAVISDMTNESFVVRDEPSDYTDDTNAYIELEDDSPSPNDGTMTKSIGTFQEAIPFSNPCEEFNKEDHIWSTLSNSFFLFAGLCYLVISIWDGYFYIEAGDDAKSEMNNLDKALYDIFAACGVFGYLIDSVIDIAWAKRIRERKRINKIMNNYLDGHMNDPCTSPEDTIKGGLCGFVMPEDNDSEYIVTHTPKKRKIRVKKLKKKIWSQIKRVRKHAAHRRDLYAACWFGLASVCATFDLIYSDGGTRLPFFFMSVHFYLASAIFALTGTRSRPISFHFSLYDPDFLEDMGDILFFVGSLVDTILCDFHFDDDVSIWPVISAFLWTLDASLYLRSDKVIQMQLEEELRISKLLREAVDQSILSSDIPSIL